MKNSDRITASLARYGAGLRFDDLPDAVVEHAKLLVLDTIGAGLWGSRLQWGSIVAGMLQDFGSAPCSSMWGTPYRVSPADAALANGTFCHGFELDDIHKNALLHAGAVTVVPALATAHERYTARPVSGAEFITAVVAGCEIGARVGLISGMAQLKQGFHAAAQTGVFAASATVAHILNISEDQFQHALGIAGSQASGLMAAQHGAMVKRMHLGRSAQSGVYAGILAQRGFTGIEDVFDAPYGGFFSVIQNLPAGKLQLPEPYSKFETLNIGFKPYSSCAATHTSIDAVLDMMERHPSIRHDRIDRVEITMSSVNKAHVGWRYEPKSVTSAQMNVGYCVAVALRNRRVFVESFTPEAITDQETIALSRRVAVHSTPDYDAMGRNDRYAVKVRIVLMDGNQFVMEKRYPKGSHMDPLNAATVVGKFKRLAEKVLSPDKVEALADIAGKLETINDVSTLDKMLLEAPESGSGDKLSQSR